MRLGSHRRGDRGASAVEFALVLPILILLVMGILEFGWLFNGWITLTGAAREGARVAAVESGDGPVVDAVNAHATTFQAAPVVAINRSGGTVTVSVTGNLQPLVGFFRTGPWVIEADATMRREYAH